MATSHQVRNHHGRPDQGSGGKRGLRHHHLAHDVLVEDVVGILVAHLRRVIAQKSDSTVGCRIGHLTHEVVEDEVDTAFISIHFRERNRKRKAELDESPDG
jgi:hypothetical protein